MSTENAWQEPQRLLIHTSIEDLEMKLRLSAKGGYPYDMHLLRASLAAERAQAAPRKGMIFLLDKEIRRQIREARRVKS